MALAPRIPQSVRLGLAFPIVLVGLPVVGLAGWLLGGSLGGFAFPLVALGILLLADHARAAADRRAALAALEVLASATRRGVPLDTACFAAGARGAGSLGASARRAMSALGHALLHGGTLSAGLDRHLPLLARGDRRAVAVAERRGSLPSTLARLTAARRRELLGPGFGVAGPPPLRLVAAHAAVLAVFLLAAWLLAGMFLYPVLQEVTTDFGVEPPRLASWLFPEDGRGSAMIPDSRGVAFGMSGTALLAVLFTLLTLAVARVLPGGAGDRGFLGDALKWLWPPHRHAAWSAAFATVAPALDAGLDLPEALHDAADASGSRIAAARLRRAADARAKDPDAPLRGFPPLARTLLVEPSRVRPRTAALLAAALADRADASAAWLHPLVLVGVVVGAAVPVALFGLALFVPLAGLIDTLAVEALQ